MKDDGGLAFGGARHEQIGMANDRNIYETVNYPGMTLRDWFAGMALQHPYTTDLNSDRPDNCSPATTARWAYALADAMLAERKK